MNLTNKIVFITGASSGIGAACAEAFAKAGAKVILTARRVDRIQALADKLQQEFSVKALPVALDVSNAKQVDQVIDGLPTEFQNIDILVNNAGTGLTTDKIQDGDVRNWDIMIDTNVKGLLYVTRKIIPSMITRNTGHIINIGSVAGHECYPGGNIYIATKHAVKAITKSLAIDLLGTQIRVSSIDPGAVKTEFSTVRWNDAEKANAFYQDFTPLSSMDIANAVVWTAAQPAHVNISEIIIMPTDQRSANHMAREGQTRAASIFTD